MNLQTIRTNPWPYAIIGWFLLFGSGMAAWVVVAVRNDPELVRPDYYEQEIAYQKQIDRLNRTASVRGEVSVAYDYSRNQVTLQLPPTRPALNAFPPASSRPACGKSVCPGPAAGRNTSTINRWCSERNKNQTPRSKHQ